MQRGGVRNNKKNRTPFKTILYYRAAAEEEQRQFPRWMESNKKPKWSIAARSTKSLITSQTCGYVCYPGYEPHAWDDKAVFFKPLYPSGNTCLNRSHQRTLFHSGGQHNSSISAFSQVPLGPHGERYQWSCSVISSIILNISDDQTLSGSLVLTLPRSKIRRPERYNTPSVWTVVNCTTWTHTVHSS